MLKGIPSILSPELLKILMEMGHADEIVIADGNFPAASIAQRLVRLDGHNVPQLLEAVLKLFPLDKHEQSILLMGITPGDNYNPVIWADYKRIVKESDPSAPEFEHLERFAFYERAKKAYAVVATGETSLYANIILKKGVIL